MDTVTGIPGEVDLHRLELRFERLRVPEPRAVERLVRSIDRAGQLVPCLVLSEGPALILLDGYRRVAALKRLARDCVQVERWECELGPALLSLMARAQARVLYPIEEALLLRELVQGRGMSQHAVAQASGRDVSWVSRRLQLVCGLPEELLSAVRAGWVSTWAATRVLGPLARANSEHASILLKGLQGEGLSTRELRGWFEHYQRSSSAVRERLVANPRLFLEAQRHQAEQMADQTLRTGPEGAIAKDLRVLLAVATRLYGQLPALAAEGGIDAIWLRQLARARHVLESLHHQLRSDHDAQADPRCGAHPAGPGPQLARDQPPAAAVA